MDAVEELAARRFVLVDDQGVRRAELSAQGPGMVGLRVYGGGDSSATVSVGISEESGRRPAIVLRKEAEDGQGYGGVILDISRYGDASLVLEDADGTSRKLTAKE